MIPSRSSGSQGDPVLQLRDVHISFASREVLRGASCMFEVGKITGVIGDNGAGKTTLLRTATTMLTPSHGEVRLGGHRLVHEDIGRRVAIGALIESPGHYDELTVRENLDFFYSFHTATRDICQVAIGRALELFGLVTVADEKVGQLSTGYRQRVAVARAFHPRARMALLDEPLAGLDPSTRSRLKDSMRSLLRRGIAICLSSHGLGDLEALCDRLYVLAAGRLHEFASFDQIRDRVRACAGTDLDDVYTKLITDLTHGAP